MTQQFVASDVGLWLSLPAFGPAIIIAAAVIFIVRRDRRRNPEPDADGDS